MRVFEVDERDSAWEDHHAHFRLFLFEGPGSAVVALDFVDAQIDDVLEAATSAAGSDKLWSIALVVDTPDAGRGLIWVSGMDYNDTPTTRAESRLRATMQDRYLMRKAARSEAPLLPDGRRVIRVFPDHGHRWPLWENFTDQYCMTPSDYGLSDGLADGLREWYDEWERHGIDWPPDVAWLAEGRRLIEALRVEVGDIAEIRAEFDH